MAIREPRAITKHETESAYVMAARKSCALTKHDWNACGIFPAQLTSRKRGETESAHVMAARKSCAITQHDGYACGIFSPHRSPRGSATTRARINAGGSPARTETRLKRGHARRDGERARNGGS